MAVINTVQHGSIGIPSAVVSTSVTLTSVDTSLTFIVMKHFPNNSTRESDTAWIPILQNSTTMVLGRGSAAVANSIAWDIVEFISGVSVTHGTTTLSTTTDTVTIPTVNTSQTFIISSATGGTFTTSAKVRTTMFYPFLTSTTSFTFQTVAIATARAAYQVVDYTGCTVQRGRTRLERGTSLATVSITAVDTTQTALLIDVINNTTTAGLFAAKIGVGTLRNGTTLILQRGSAGELMEFGWQVLEFTDGTKVQGVISATTVNMAATVASTNITITAVDVTKSATWFSGPGATMVSGDGTADTDVYCYLMSRFINSTTMNTSRVMTETAVQRVAFNVIQFNSVSVAVAVEDRSFVFAGW